jgi:hypothetical protein
MQIKSYNSTELKEFVGSDFYNNLNRIPMSTHRALSHTKNPDVQDDDELLWAAYEEEELVGYVGVLPNYIVENLERKKIFWLSCFWVDEKFRKENVASMLFFLLIKKYGKQLFVSNFLPSLESMYQSLSIFKPTIYKSGSQFYCQSCFHDILPVRYPKIKFLTQLLRVGDLLMNGLFGFRRLFYKPLSINSTVVSDTNFDAEFNDFLHSFYTDKNYVEKSSAHFDWMINYPWVLQGEPDDESKRYYFSSKSKQFGYESVKFYKENQLKAFLWLKIRDKKLSVSYIFTEDAMTDDIAAYILHKVFMEKLLILTVFDERIANKIRTHRILYLFERFIKCAYILPKTQEATPDFFQEGDGDKVLT